MKITSVRPSSPASAYRRSDVRRVERQEQKDGNSSDQERHQRQDQQPAKPTKRVESYGPNGRLEIIGRDARCRVLDSKI